jgi:hypothetical protein
VHARGREEEDEDDGDGDGEQAVTGREHASTSLDVAAARPSNGRGRTSSGSRE